MSSPARSNAGHMGADWIAHSYLQYRRSQTSEEAVGIADWFRFERGPAVEIKTKFEFDLGPDDWLLIETAEVLSDKTCARIKEIFEPSIKEPGRKVIVLSGGLSASVIHRKVMP